MTGSTKKSIVASATAQKVSWAGEVCGGGYSVLVEKDGGGSFPSDWLPNSYRFATEAEANGFIKNLKQTWEPADFVRGTRVKKSTDPVTHRWDDRRQKVVSVPGAPASEPVVTAAAATELVELEQDYGPVEEPEQPAVLVDEERYRPRVRKLPKRRFSRELYRGYRDRTKWYEREQRIEVPLNHTPDGYGVLSDAIRHDIRNLLAHGDCRFELSRRLFDFYMTAHGGRMPEEQIDTGKYRVNIHKRRLLAADKALRAAPNNAKTQSAYNKAEKAYAATGGDLCAWRAAIKVVNGELRYKTADGETVIVSPTTWELMIASEMEAVWKVTTRAVDMLDLTRWLATTDAHAITGWFSDRGWHGPAQTMKDLIAALNLEEGDRAALDLETLEAAELAEKMARSQGREARLELFKSRLKAPRNRGSDRRPLEYGGKCRLPNLQKFVARNGGDCSDISIRAWERFNKEIEEWKTCIGCDEHWPDPDWRRWYVEKTIEIWGETQKR